MFVKKFEWLFPITNIIKYNLYYVDKLDIQIGKIPKQMRKYFNKILPSELLNKFDWIINDFDYFMTKHKEFNKKGVVINY